LGLTDSSVDEFCEVTVGMVTYPGLLEWVSLSTDKYVMVCNVTE